MASTYLTRTQGTPTSNDIGTISCWIKRGTLDKNNEYILQNYVDANNYGYIRFKSDNQIQVYSNSLADEKRTNRLFRDTSAWYHVVLRVDTTQSTANDRVRLYINGIQETSLSTNTNGAQNANYDLFKSGGTLRIGYPSSGTAINFDGSMSHFHYCDGQSYAPTAFGEYDANGVWKIKTSPSVTYGNEGFFILKDGNSVTDQSGQGNNWTVGGGTLTKTEDCPSNVFATWNPLYKNNSTFSNGNTTSASGSSGEFNSASTLGMPSGKWYMEFKRVSGNYPMFGIVDDIALAEYSNANMGLGKTGTTKSIALRLNDGKTRVNNVATTQGGSISNGDIVGVAVDKSTNKIYFSKNGQWSNGSGAWDSTTFNASTGATDVSSILTGDTWFFACGTDTGEASNTFSANFGNGYFGTTQISSAGTNASGIGIFEYDCPDGYTALSTKGLNL